MADEKKAAFGIFPQMKPRRSRQDPEAAKDVPRQLLRGWAAGTLGLPGDIEGLIRMLPGLDETPRLPTSEFYLDYLPGKAEGAAGEAAAGLGTLFGGVGSTKVARGALEAGKAAGKVGRAMAESVGTGPSPGGLAAQRGVIKMPGGNWISGNVERAVEPLKRPAVPQQLADELGIGVENKAQDALNNWVDRNLTNYIKKQMGTPDDPVRKLIEETGSAHIPLERSWEPESLPSRRRAVGFPIEGFAAKKLNELPAGANEKTISDLEKAIEWESRTDQIIGNLPVKEWQAISNPKFEAANSWMSKVDPNTMAYRVAEAELKSDLGFDHIIDVLREDLAAGRIRPEQLNKVSMEQAVRRTYEYDQEMAKKMREAQIKATEGMPIYKKYPEGYKWVELKPNKSLEGVDDGFGNISSPGYEELEKALKYEGETMGHCVGGYCDDVYQGRSRIFSLRDAKGEPHVTIEVQPIAPDWQGVKKAGGDPSAIMTEAKRRMGIDTPENEAELLRSMNGDQRYNLQKELDRHFADVFKEQFGDISPNIVQIKGKQNRAPKEEYLPFVQDFVRSGQWSDVGDIRNTGLVRRMDLPQDERHLFPQDSDYITMEELRKLREGKDSGMKRGGKVRFSDNPDTMQLEMAAGGAAAKTMMEALAKLKLLREEAAAKAAQQAQYAKEMEGVATRDMPTFDQWKAMQENKGYASGGEITADDLIIEERPL